MLRMLSDEIMEKIFSHKDMKSVPVGYQSIVIEVVGDILDEIARDNKYAAVSELLTDTDAYLSGQL